MIKRNRLKVQLILGVGLAFIVIIISAFYFIRQLNKFTEENDLIIKLSEERYDIANTIETNLYQVIQHKRLIVSRNRDYDPLALKNETIAVRRGFVKLDNSNAYFKNSSHAQKQLHTSAMRIIDLKQFEQRRKTDDIIDLEAQLVFEQNQTKNNTRDYTQFITQERSKALEINKERFSEIEKIAFILICISLIGLLFTFFKVFQVLSYWRKSSNDLLERNDQYLNVKKTIENANWILEESSRLAEHISGKNNENEIAQNGFEKILNALHFQAGTLYIRKTDSYEFHLKEHIGVDQHAAMLQSFIVKEGLLGHIAHQQEIQVIDNIEASQLKTSTALLENQIKTIIIVPFVYENHTLGILEIGGNFESENELPKVLQYLGRAARSMAMTIKFAQSRTLVENLLEETQHQAEEMEAQQEELRITNEELIYKTNLLEASEEELRVQQEELHQTNVELENKARQLEDRNNELNAAKNIVEEKINEVEQASQYKSEFMANMSHELRTPLNSILILAKLLQDNKAQNLNQDQVKYASIIHSAGSDLLELINELLDLAKIESGKVDLNLETIQTSTFVANLENLFAETAAQKDITFTLDIDPSTPPNFVTDEYRVEQVLKNFLSNAFKFTDRMGTVKFSITADHDNLKFAVEDTGKGISKEKQELVFEAFLQEDGSTSRKYGGTGLGLSISREIAQLLNGRISLKSTLDVGSTFTLIIPYTRAEELNSKLPVSTIVNTPKVTMPVVPVEKALQIENPEALKTLLIIEDDINFAYILKDFSQANGFQATVAHDGATGIEKALEMQPHAIILDVMLPIHDGWEVLRILKNNDDTKHIPIHMMSAATFDKRDFIERGAIGFMAKPVTEQSIISAFKNINFNLSSDVKKVLLIEDQEFQSELIKAAFAEHNINIIQAFSAQSALTKLTVEDHIDCIILDIKLPDGDGLTVLDTIKSMDKYEDTPIIINTAYDLSKEQINHIQQYTKAMVLKSGKSNSRLIDEVTLFLNKISDENYSPLRNMERMENTSGTQDALYGKRVLIADDDMRNVFALTTSLQDYNMEIEIANNGLEAVQIVNTQARIDIILMDIMMPEMDGYEAIQTIRQNKQHAHIPILAVTAKAMKGDRDKCIQLGASDYISKPIDIDKLISLMRVWLS